VRRAIIVVLALLAGASCGPKAVPAPANAPKLVVLLVIDQLPTWAFERDRGMFTGGFARLLREGGYVRAAELPYANSFTAPGHATVGTGTTPSIHGVIGNQWYRRGEGKEVGAEDDPAAPMFRIVTEPIETPGAAPPLLMDDTASAIALRVEGLSEALRAVHPKSVSVAIALKSRAAVFVAGRRPDLAIWYEASAGGMTTSRAYANALPAWLTELAKAKPHTRFVGQTWEPLDAAVLANATGIPDDGPGEGDVHGLGTAFPHPITDPDAIVHTPFGDEVVLDTVYAAMTAMSLGNDDEPDLLAIGLNAHDYAGHVYGPDSWESLDLTLRLDRALGELFAAFDRRVGPDGWALVMTSDHGATPLVERSPIGGARRVPTGAIVAAANDALVPILGEGAWVAMISSNQLYFGNPINDPATKARAIDAAVAAIMKVPGIEGVYRVVDTIGNCESRAGMERVVCFGLAPDASGDLYLVPVRGSLVTEYTTGTHHDSPSAENREVPVIVRAPGLAPQTLDRASFLQVAPTVAALLRVPPPKAAIAPTLFSIR
jgi:predicted AlkP superfamily pyrophosphatase or phosphodiesterase